ncbi:hypothetical protein Nepgr_029338 [Nepenthes gracilis]|uniref:Uncharacterized protein n=1 Tax=Nepenthes gracilis TaxID=150966 RepID=A0AAD3Y4R7_NEPGR|nr:hypothetical protein Nepgr_029338 [Nepenthes gracilis]
MVVVGGELEHEREKTGEENILMTTTPQRSRTLHNFTLPCLKWGKQKHLRCIKIPDADHMSSLYSRSSPSGSGHHRDFGGLLRIPAEPERIRRSLLEPENVENSPSEPPARKIGSKSLLDGEYDNGIEAIRAKLMLDLQTEVDKMKTAILSQGNKEIEPLRTEVAAAEPDMRPWSLRTRRALRKELDANNGGFVGGGGGGTSLRVDEGKPNFLPTTTNENKSSRLRSKMGCENGRNGGEKRSRPEFSVSLSKQEIEDDFMAIVGTKPPRRPKKRSKHVQKQLDTLFPGLWLSEITPHMYQVNENLNAAKR